MKRRDKSLELILPRAKAFINELASLLEKYDAVFESEDDCVEVSFGFSEAEQELCGQTCLCFGVEHDYDSTPNLVIWTSPMKAVRIYAKKG